MRASDSNAVGFLGLMAAAAALPLAAVAVLNLTMDPYSAGLGQWHRLRAPIHDDVADRVPDTGTAARVNAVIRSRAPVLILGTSRAQVGFETDPSHAFNAGQAAAAFDDMLRVAEAAAARPLPPRLYVIEAPVELEPPASRARASEPGWPGPEDRLLASEATHVSLHLLGHYLGMGTPQETREDFFLPLPLPIDAPPRAARLPDSAIGTAFKQGSTPPPVYLRTALDRLLRLCARTRAAATLLEPPVHPDLLADPRVVRTVSERIFAYTAVAAQLAPRHPQCRFRFLDMSGLATDTRVPIASDRHQWFDRLHFSPRVGETLLGEAVADQMRVADGVLRP